MFNYISILYGIDTESVWYFSSITDTLISAILRNMGSNV